MHLSRWLARSIVAVLVPIGAASAEEPHPDWRLTANASSIVVGRLTTPPVDVMLEAQKASVYIYLSIESEQVLKGEGGAAFVDVRYFPEVRSFPEVRGFAPSIASILESDGDRVVAFLVASEGETYFAAHTPRALQPASPEDIEALVREVTRQQAVIDGWTYHLGAPLWPEVKREIERAVTDRGQSAAFAQLERFGIEAVPAIVDLMDDRRTLARQEITLRNKSPDAFEEYRHYGPELMVDALDAILNQITGMSCGSIGNGATDEERDRAVGCWRIYADYLVNHAN